MVGRTWCETMNGGTYIGVGTKMVGRSSDGREKVHMVNVPPLLLSQIRATIKKWWHVDNVQKNGGTYLGRIWEKVFSARWPSYTSHHSGFHPSYVPPFVRGMLVPPTNDGT